MQIIRKTCHPLSLKGIRKRQAANFWPQRSVVVTFDDGYADNFHAAREVLEANDIPATVFVTSGMVDSQKEFWWDELERIFLSTTKLPTHLEITINHQVFSWVLNDRNEERGSLAWNVLDDRPPSSRQRLYLELMSLMHDIDLPTRESVLSELAVWAGIDRNSVRHDYRAVSIAELHSLPHKGLIEIGAHTITHPSLFAIPLTTQADEILGSKAELEKILSHPVESFAYPFGERRDYSGESIKLVRDAGFTCACSNYPGLVNSTRDPYQLPRYIVRDWDGETFARKLKNWFHE